MNHNGHAGAMHTSPLTKSVSACASVAACVSAFFGTPPAYSLTVFPVLEFCAEHYAITASSDLATMIAITWWLLVLVIIFVTAKLAFSAVFLALASRFLSRWV